MGMAQKRQVRYMPEYQKALICPYESNGPVIGKRFYVQFNPSEISIQEAVGRLKTDEDNIMEKFRKLLQADSVNAQHPLKGSCQNHEEEQLVLSVTLFFNTLTSLYQSTYEDVRKYIRKLYPYTNTKGNFQSIFFLWGSIAVRGYLRSMNVQYTMFAPDGMPVRAQVSISIEGEYVGEEDLTKFKSVELKGDTGLTDNGVFLLTDPYTWRNYCDSTGNPRL